MDAEYFKWEYDESKQLLKIIWDVDDIEYWYIKTISGNKIVFWDGDEEYPESWTLTKQ